MGNQQISAEWNISKRNLLWFCIGFTRDCYNSWAPNLSVGPCRKELFASMLKPLIFIFSSCIFCFVFWLDFYFFIFCYRLQGESLVINQCPLTTGLFSWYHPSLESSMRAHTHTQRTPASQPAHSFTEILLFDFFVFFFLVSFVFLCSTNISYSTCSFDACYSLGE